MLSVQAFVKNVQAIDEKFALFSPSIIEDPDYIPISKKFWLNELETFIEENEEEITKKIDEIESAVKKQYAKYVSPLFKSFLIHLRYEDFPYTLNRNDYKTFIDQLRSAKTPAKAEQIVKDFKVDGDRYFLNTKLRPWHPVLYMLLELKKESKSQSEIDIDAPKMIASIYPYIIFPQNKSAPEILCALSMTLGLPIKTILKIRSTQKLDDFVLKINGEGSTFSRPVLCRAEDVGRALDFVAAQKYSQRASQSSLETSTKVLGFEVSAHSMPALYQALCVHFFTPSEKMAEKFLERYDLTIQSKFEFKIQGESNLTKIIKGILEERQQKIEAVLAQSSDKIRGRLAEAIDHFEKKHTEKVGTTNIRKAIKCSPVLAMEINDALASL